MLFRRGQRVSNVAPWESTEFKWVLMVSIGVQVVYWAKRVSGGCNEALLSCKHA